MKKLILLIAISVTTLAASAQKKNAAQEIYDKLEQEDDVLSLSFNKKMIDAIDSDVEWGSQIKYLKGDLNQVKLLIIDDDSKESKSYSKYIYKRLGSLGYKLTDLPKDAEDDLDDDEDIFLFTNKKNDRFTEAHMLIVDEDGGAIFISIYGDITVTDEKI